MACRARLPTRLIAAGSRGAVRGDRSLEVGYRTFVDGGLGLAAALNHPAVRVLARGGIQLHGVELLFRTL